MIKVLINYFDEEKRIEINPLIEIEVTNGINITLKENKLMLELNKFQISKAHWLTQGICRNLEKKKTVRFKKIILQ